MHQIVYTRLHEISNREISTPARALIVQIDPKEAEIENLAESLSGLGDCLLGVEFLERDLTDYIYLNESNKEMFIKQLHIVNVLGELLNRPIYLVAELKDKFPEWDVCKQHVHALFSQYAKLFPNILFACRNTCVKYSIGRISNAPLSYVLQYFKDISTVQYIADMTVPSTLKEPDILKEYIGKVIAIQELPDAKYSKMYNTPIIIKGVTFMDMVMRNRGLEIPTIRVMNPNIAGTDNFANAIRSIVETMSK